MGKKRDAPAIGTPEPWHRPRNSDDAAGKNRKAFRAERKKLVPRLKNPGAVSFGWNGKPAAPALGDAPAKYRPGKRQGRRPARTRNLRGPGGSLFADGWTVRRAERRWALRLSGEPRHLTRGVPHMELARPAFSATVTVPLRLRWRAARRPADPHADPASPRWPRGVVPPGERNPVSGSWPAPQHPKTPAPHGFAVSAVQAGGPVLVPSRGGARTYAFPFHFLFPQIVSVVAELGPTRGTRRSGAAVLDFLSRRAWADGRSAAVKSAGFRRLRKQVAAVTSRPMSYNKLR